MRKPLLAAIFCIAILITASADGWSRIILWEDFENDLPLYWTVEDNLGGGVLWLSSNPAGREGYYYPAYPTFTYWMQLDRGIMIADSEWWADNMGPAYADTDLISDGIECTGYENIELTFGADFESKDAQDDAYFLVGTGSGDHEAMHWDGTDHFDEMAVVDLSPYADGESLVELIWRYSTGGTDQLFWAIDNVLLTGDCPVTYEEPLIEDDGGYEANIAINNAFSTVATCIAPQVYPSYLAEISAYISAGSGNGAIQWVIYKDEDGWGPPGPAPMYASAPFIPSIDGWNQKDLRGLASFDVPILSGSWCIGLRRLTTSTTFIGRSTESANGHSWVNQSSGWRSADSVGYSGRPAIRAVSENCNRGVGTTTTTTTTTTIPTTTTTTSTTTGTTTTTSPGTTTTTIGTTTTTTAGTTTTTFGTTTTTHTTTTTAGSTTTTTHATTTTFGTTTTTFGTTTTTTFGTTTTTFGTTTTTFGTTTTTGTGTTTTTIPADDDATDDATDDTADDTAADDTATDDTAGDDSTGDDSLADDSLDDDAMDDDSFDDTGDDSTDDTSDDTSDDTQDDTGDDSLSDDTGDDDVIYVPDDDSSSGERASPNDNDANGGCCGC